MVKKIVIYHLFLFTFALFNQSVYAQDKAIISIEQPAHDFGKIQEEGGAVTHTFVIRNDGKAPLELSQVIASCGCTSLEWTQQPVQAGKTTNVSVAYDPKGRPGDFEKNVTVYSNGSKDPQILTIKGHVEAKQVGNEKQPVFFVENTVHDFGLINETDGEAMSIFKVKNMGEAPLVITHVQTSCGCAEPEWTREPIQPGEFGDVVIIYNPTNRPGPFKKNITVYTNEPTKRQRLTIKGDVIPKPRKLNASFRDTIGVVQMEAKDFLFYTMRPQETQAKEIWIQNFSDEDVFLSTANVPAYIKVEAPEKLEPMKPQRFKVSLDGTTINKKGRLLSEFTLKTKTASGKESDEAISIIAHFIDDFSKLTPTERSNSARVQLSPTLLEFGKLKKRKAVSQSITVTNEGRSPLIIHSATVDDPRVEVVALKSKTIQPGESMDIEVRILPKKLKGTLDTELHIVCNDTSGPIRQARITAEK